MMACWRQEEKISHYLAFDSSPASRDKAFTNFLLLTRVWRRTLGQKEWTRSCLLLMMACWRQEEKISHYLAFDSSPASRDKAFTNFLLLTRVWRRTLGQKEWTRSCLLLMMACWRQVEKISHYLVFETSLASRDKTFTNFLLLTRVWRRTQDQKEMFTKELGGNVFWP